MARDLVVFLDYDGTLVPICDRPEEALLSPATREVLRALAKHVPVVVVSGRDRAVVAELVGLDEVQYIGSHGLDIGDDAPAPARKATPALDEAERILNEQLETVAGAMVERKRFSVAAHFRLVRPEDAPRVEEAVAAALAGSRGLRRSEGKKVIEVRPDIAWDKGRALMWVLDRLDLRQAFPLYIGDDVTDEDAFAAVQPHGLGIVVAPSARPTQAQHSLADPDAVRLFLAALAEAAAAPSLRRAAYR